MTREQAINNMISHGFTVEQAGEIFKAVTPQLSVPEVTALAEWTEKLTKASVDAYNMGYADGMKAQEPRKGHWIENAEEYYKAINERGGGVNENTPYFVDDIACSKCLTKFSVIDNEAERFDFCPCCGSNNK